MFGKKKNVSPVTDKHRETVENLRKQMSALDGMENVADKFAAMSRLTMELEQLKEKLPEDIDAFFKKAGDSLINKLAAGTGGGTAATALGAAFLLSGPIAVGIAFGGLTLGSLGLIAGDNVTKEVFIKKRELFKQNCAELQSLTRMTDRLTETRKIFFEAPKNVKALTSSADFPSLYELANADEKKILSFAFRMAAEDKETPSSPVLKPIEGKPRYKPEL